VCEARQSLAAFILLLGDADPVWTGCTVARSRKIASGKPVSDSCGAEVGFMELFSVNPFEGDLWLQRGDSGGRLARIAPPFFGVFHEEHDAHFVPSFALLGEPGFANEQRGTGTRHEACLLEILASARLSGRLARLDMPSREKAVTMLFVPAYE